MAEGEAAVNIKDWIHCNNCYTEPHKDRRSTRFIITSCGHLFCGSCYGEREEGFCLACKAACSVVDLSKEVPEDVKLYFKTPESLMEKFIFQFQQMTKFQMEQRAKLVQHKIQKLEEFADRKQKEILLYEKENARLKLINLNLESRVDSILHSSATISHPPTPSLRTGCGPVQTPPRFTGLHRSLTIAPSRGHPLLTADRPVCGLNTLTTFPMGGTNTTGNTSSDTQSFPPPPKPSDPSLTLNQGILHITPRESGRGNSMPHSLQHSIRRSASFSSPYISPSIVSSAVARRPGVAMTLAVNDSSVLSCIRARAQERGGAMGGASGRERGKRKLDSESMRPPSAKRVLNSLIAPGRLSIRTPPIDGRIGVIRSSLLLSSASPRHEEVPMSVTPTPSQIGINERRLSAPASMSAFQSRRGNNGTSSRQRSQCSIH